MSVSKSILHNKSNLDIDFTVESLITYLKKNGIEIIFSDVEKNNNESVYLIVAEKYYLRSSTYASLTVSDEQPPVLKKYIG